LEIKYREARKSGVALNGGCVFARGKAFVTNAFGEFLESLAEDHLHAETAGDLVGDTAVAGAGHALIALLQTDDVGGLDDIVFKARLEEGPTLSFFDVPGDQSKLDLILHRLDLKLSYEPRHSH